mmetsp:Transcript_16260/g.45077  ORF Transcript_16260/g.45077 Transcript_16260/m.45077 type:complete len:135 (-) Transcript_16260:1458-1862(-)
MSIESETIERQQQSSSPSSSPPSSPQPQNKLVTAVHAILGKKISCTLSDGRKLSGTLVCVDRLKNVILCNVTEERTIDPSHYNNSQENKGKRCQIERKLSQALIPGKHLVRVEVPRPVYDHHLSNIRTIQQQTQ